MNRRKYTREECIQMLITCRESLCSQGVSRYPQRSDFQDDEVVAIKSLLGPWPRALEAAGVKPACGDEKKQRRREKHIRAKRRRNTALREAKKAQQADADLSAQKHNKNI